MKTTISSAPTGHKFQPAEYGFLCELCGCGLDDHSPASPVDSVGVPALPPLPLKLSAGLIITDDRGVDIAASMSPTDTLHGEKCFELRKQYMGAIVEACNSHAAHLAKIKALEEAGKRLLDHLSMETPKKDLASYAAYTLESLNLQDAFHAALALTSA
jgi:hypothetical protein